MPQLFSVGGTAPRSRRTWDPSTPAERNIRLSEVLRTTVQLGRALDRTQDVLRSVRSGWEIDPSQTLKEATEALALVATGLDDLLGAEGGDAALAALRTEFKNLLAEAAGARRAHTAFGFDMDLRLHRPGQVTFGRRGRSRLAHTLRTDPAPVVDFFLQATGRGGCLMDKLRGRLDRASNDLRAPAPALERSA
jgi:hypothetical protein